MIRRHLLEKIFSNSVEKKLHLTNNPVRGLDRDTDVVCPSSRVLRLSASLPSDLGSELPGAGSEPCRLTPAQTALV